MRFKSFGVVLAAVFMGAGLFAADVDKKAELPKVLIIGDSISLGYTPHVREFLKGRAVVTHCQGNAGPTINGIDNIDKWVGDTKWDVIFFNWGLWDMYGWRFAKQDRSPDMYEKRLEKLVSRLEQTGAKLIWATTTPVCPDPEVTMHKRFKTDVVISPKVEKEYLETASRVMKRHNVKVCDLHEYMKPLREKYTLGADNVHYTRDGYRKLGKQVADAISQDFANVAAGQAGVRSSTPTARKGAGGREPEKH